MATQQVLFAAAPSQTLTAKLFAVGSQTEAYSTTSVTELPASSGLYSAIFVDPTAIAGNYRLIGLNGSDGVCHYKVPFTGTDGETISGVEFTEGASTSAIAGAVWDVATADHQTAGTTGKALTDAGGGSSSVVVYPIQSVTPQRTNETTLKAYLNETVSFTVLPVDADGDPVDTTALTLAVVIEDRQTTDVETITDASITKTATSYTFSTSTSNTTLGQKRWSCRNTANANVISTGQYVVTYAPE